MICVSIAEPNVERCLAALEGIGLAEVRMERMVLAREDIRRIFASSAQLIATCRPGPLPDDRRGRLLADAIEAGASYVDVEIESEETLKRHIIEAARRQGCRVILSFHDYEKTPGLRRLNAIISRCFTEGADVAKIACTVHSGRDNARLLGLLDRDRRGKKLIVVGMGEKGKITRIVAPFLGSPFSYASPSEGKETSEGQMTRKRLEAIMESIHHG